MPALRARHHRGHIDESVLLVDDESLLRLLDIGRTVGDWGWRSHPIIERGCCDRAGDLAALSEVMELRI